MKVLILAPNGGVSLSTGGGVNFVLKQAYTLDRLGHEVTIAGFHSLPREDLSRIHSVQISRNVKIASAASTTSYNAFRAVPVKLSAYNALLDPRFRHWIERLFESVEPEAVWFNDDIPRVASRYRKRCRFYLYVHFPLAGRTTRVTPLVDRTAVERLNDIALRATSSLYLVNNPFDLCDGVWTNSTVTSRVVHLVWGQDGVYLPTYVLNQGSHIVKSGDHSVISIGSFTKGKNYAQLIEGFAKARPANWKLQVAGHERDGLYIKGLRRLIRRLEVEDSVELVVSPSGEHLHQLVNQASLVVHPARFEPFGLALLEAMSAGLGAVAFRGAYSGGWLDILDQGKYGRGFNTSADLAEQLTHLAHDGQNLAELQEQARARAAMFSQSIYERRMEEIHGRVTRTYPN